MYCPNCGSHVPEGTRFCVSCGQPVEQFAQTPVQLDVVSVPVGSTPETAPAMQMYEPAQNRAASVSIKTGIEQIFGIILIVVAILGLFLGFVQTDYMVLNAVGFTTALFFVYLIDHIVVPVVMLLTGIFALSFANRVAKAQAPKTWVQGAALADIILGIGMLVTTLLGAAQFVAQTAITNYPDAYSIVNILSIVSLGMFFLFLAASAVVHFVTSGRAKDLNTSGTMGIVAGVLLAAYALYRPIFMLSIPSIQMTLLGEYGYDVVSFSRILTVISAIGTLFLVAALVTRGIFWIGVAKKVAAYLSATTPAQGGNNYAPSYGAAPTPGSAEISGGAKFG
jgi:hypothetical protein